MEEGTNTGKYKDRMGINIQPFGEGRAYADDPRYVQVGMNAHGGFTGMVCDYAGSCGFETAYFLNGVELIDDFFGEQDATAEEMLEQHYPGFMCELAAYTAQYVYFCSLGTSSPWAKPTRKLLDEMRQTPEGCLFSAGADFAPLGISKGWTRFPLHYVGCRTEEITSPTDKSPLCKITRIPRHDFHSN